VALDAPAPTAPDQPVPDSGGLSRRARAGIVIVLGSLVVMWTAVVAVRLTRDEPDRLDDRAAVSRTEDVCAATRAGLPSVPPGRDAETAAARADRLDAETAALTAMVAELETIPWSGGRDARLVGQWLADWRQHLADRTAYAESVRSTGRNDVVFNGFAPDGESVTYRMDAFADTNDLDSCLTPSDPRVNAT
jgi:hypothetical protein